MGRLKLLREVLANVFRKPATIEYPKEKTEVESDARGLQYADLNKCIGCGLCSIECPANAITMEKLPEGVQAPRNPRRVFPVINYLKCIFCYRCVAVCPTNAYITTSEYRLATFGEVVSRRLSLATLEKKAGGVGVAEHEH